MVVVAPDVFTNNRLSLNLISDHPMSALVDLITVDGQKCALVLSDYLIDPQFGQSLSMSEAAFQYSNKSQGLGEITFYEWLQLNVSSLAHFLPRYLTFSTIWRRSSKIDEKWVFYLFYDLKMCLMDKLDHDESYDQYERSHWIALCSSWLVPVTMLPSLIDSNSSIPVE